jgi:hypothetical protein
MPTTPRSLRIPDDIWSAAIAAFPAEPGRPGGLTAEVVGFIEFIGGQPETWRAVKAVAAQRGIDPWHLMVEALGALTTSCTCTCSSTLSDVSAASAA